MTQEGRYKSIFELTPISLWEEDWTELYATFDAMRAEGVVDFREHFNKHPEILAELAQKVKITDVNRISLEMFGASSKEHLLGSLDRVFIPETYPIWLDTMVVMADREPYAGEAYAGTLDGKKIYVYVNLIPLPPHEGISRSLLSIVDISRRKDAEDQLAAQERLYRTLTESIPHMVWMGDARGKLSYCNQAMRKATGLAAGVLEGKDWTDTIHPDDRSKILDVRQAAQERSKPYRGEYRYRSTDGSHRTVHFIDTPVKSETGEVLNWVGVNTDITELKGTQEELQRALERSNRELAQIAYAASHDLQEPLRMVTSYAQLLEQHYAENLDDKADKYLGYMVQGAKRIRQLILDLLTMSNIHIEGKELARADLQAIAAHVVDGMQPELDDLGAEITCTELPAVMGDIEQLAMLFRTLFENSLKFRAEVAPRITVSARREGAMWQLAVKDNGKGFDSEKYGERIFEMFRRLHTHDQYPGTGIGLTIAKKIVERHGGRVWAESMPGAGATFFFTLPAIDVEMLDDVTRE